MQPLNSAITLDRPLGSGHAINAPVIDAAVTNAGYQGPPAPDQWFGGPALSAGAGNMVLRDAHGLVADSLNYGSLVHPWLAEGYQGISGAGQAGCTVPPPGTTTAAGSSAVRYPDGTDTDSNCTDFTSSNNPTPGRPTSANFDEPLPVPTVVGGRRGRALLFRRDTRRGSCQPRDGVANERACGRPRSR